MEPRIEPVAPIEPERPTSQFWRQLDIVNMDNLRTMPIVVVGAGSVGSFTVLSLAKMGAENITVYDDDKVEPHNLPNQFFRMKDVGSKKVTALKKIVKDFTGIEIKSIPGRFQMRHDLQGIVIATVDTMASREIIWKRAKMNPMVKLYVDSRMGAQVYDIQSLRPTDMDAVKAYDGTWYDDKDAIQERCSEKAIIYTVMAMANILCNVVKRYVQAQDIPYRITGDCVTLMQSVEDGPLEMEEPDSDSCEKDYSDSENERVQGLGNQPLTAQSLRTAMDSLTINNPTVSQWVSTVNGSVGL